MRNFKLLGILPILVLVLAACAPAATGATPTLASIEPIATETETTEPLSTETPAVETATTEVTTGATITAETPAAVGTTTVGVPVTGSATVNVSESPEYGPILVNEEGHALYIFMNDTQNSGASTCTAECATIWPPLISDGPPAAGEGVDDFLLATLPRDDGSTQVMYNGWPLYLYHGDTAPGDTNGHGVTDSGGRWFLVTPSGDPL